MIIFPLPVAPGHRCPFGIGRILAITNGKDLEFQWLGNFHYQPFMNGWKNLSEDLGYYAEGKKMSPAWTGTMTSTFIDTSFVFAGVMTY